jgi:ribosome modulation factor
MYQPGPRGGNGDGAASQSPTQRDYWPTAGWRTAKPDQQAMDPAVLDDLDTAVPDIYPQVRSVLVICHGYLVYERYWQGLPPATATTAAR